MVLLSRYLEQVLIVAEGCNTLLKYSPGCLGFRAKSIIYCPCLGQQLAKQYKQFKTICALSARIGTLVLYYILKDTPIKPYKELVNLIIAVTANTPLATTVLSILTSVKKCRNHFIKHDHFCEANRTLKSFICHNPVVKLQFHSLEQTERCGK